MRIGMADSAGADADQNIGWPDLWNGNFRIFQLFAEFPESDGFHECSTLNAQHSTCNQADNPSTPPFGRWMLDVEHWTFVSGDISPVYQSALKNVERATYRCLAAR
jgi:hypothetical protein